MIGAVAVYSPGYQVPLWLGPAQVRLWRKLDRLIGGRTFAAHTVRGLARELGSNPGTISRDLDALARLGLAVHDSAWGRAGVRLWRVVSVGGRTGLDAKRQRRALARMGIRAEAPGQLALTIEAIAAPDPPPSASPTLSAAHPVDSVNDTPDRAGTAEGAPEAGDAGASPPASGPFRTETCACGRSRLIMAGRELSPCPHPPTMRSTLGLER